MDFNEIYKHLNDNKIIITDIFNVFNTKSNIRFDNYNFIINDSDIVAKNILRNFSKNINSTDILLKKVYVNPYDTYKSTSTLYIRPPAFNLIKTKEIVTIFKYPFKKLNISDNKNYIHNMLNLETISNIENSVIWEFNPGYDSLVNTDILMQKLIGDVIYITTDTYNKVIGDIVNYNTFKKLNVVKVDTYTSEDCQDTSESNNYSLYGFDLTHKWTI